MFLGWLISSLSDEVHAQEIGSSTPHEVWRALEASFVAHSRVRILQLYIELQALEKGSESIQKYFQRAKTIAHYLAVATRPVSDEDLVFVYSKVFPLNIVHFRHQFPRKLNQSALPICSFISSQRNFESAMMQFPPIPHQLPTLHNTTILITPLTAITISMAIVEIVTVDAVKDVETHPMALQEILLVPDALSTKFAISWNM